MAFNWQEIGEFALLALTETAQVAPQLGGPDHIAAAGAALNAASQVATAVITDPTQQAEAKAAYNTASSVLALLGLFFKKKGTTAAIPQAPLVAG